MNGPEDQGSNTTLGGEGHAQRGVGEAEVDDAHDSTVVSTRGGGRDSEDQVLAHETGPIKSPTLAYRSMPGSWNFDGPAPDDMRREEDTELYSESEDEPNDVVVNGKGFDFEDEEHFDRVFESSTLHQQLSVQGFDSVQATGQGGGEGPKEGDATGN